MPREIKSDRTRRLNQILGILERTYPNAHCELNYSNPLELLVATILSAQSTDKQVNIVTKELFRKYRSPQDFAKVPLPELENDLRSIGLFRNKARNIQSCCQQLIQQHSGEVPRSIEALTQLAGVGRKTANVVLGNAFGLNHGIVVDTHVTRLSQRLGFTKKEKPEEIEKDLQKVVPTKDWTQVSHWLIWHGRRCCYARNPNCGACPLAALCPAALVE